MKKFVITILSLSLIFAPLFGSNVKVQAEANLDASYMIIIDASGSMIGNSRMERAKTSAENFLNSLKGENVEVGLMAFYACGPDGTKVLHGLTTDLDELIQPLKQIQPSGLTPLAGAIAFGGNYLTDNGLGDKGKLVVYTDGVETCGGSYQDAREAIEGFEIDIWGIDLSPEDEQAIEEGIGQTPKDMDEEPPAVDLKLNRILANCYPEKFEVGQVVQINVMGEWSDGSITHILPKEVKYKSSRPDRAIVSDNGKMTALASGTSFIDLEYRGKTLRTVVRISPAPTISDLYLESSIPSTLTLGDKHIISGLKAKWSDGSVSDVSLSDVTVTSSRNDRVRVTNGELEAIAKGTSYINIGYKGKTIRSLVKVNAGEAEKALTDLYQNPALPSTLLKGDKHTINGLKAKWSDGSITDVSISDVTVSSSPVRSSTSGK